jgi:16S rRNA (adenine1518-N6/adenine1519-N6)-dimethyltransferase
MSISNKIAELPPLREIVAQHGLQANKAFGQNYLFDLNLTNKIAKFAGDLSGVTVFEIGPGPGGLTRALLAETNAKQIIAIEKDPRFIEALQPLVDLSENRLQVIEGDALKTDPIALASAPRAIIANLPYNVGTELLIGWLHTPNEYTQFILMFQKEVAQRIVAKQNTKAYGRLAVLVQNLCTAEIAMNVGPAAFTPPPKVTSSVIRLKPKPDAANVPIEILEKVTAAAFGQRRKMLRQSMKQYLPVLEELNIDPQLRAEDLSVTDFLKIAQHIKLTGFRTAVL